jgi:hypothetical protein
MEPSLGSSDFQGWILYLWVIVFQASDNELRGRESGTIS